MTGWLRFSGIQIRWYWHHTQWHRVQIQTSALAIPNRCEEWNFIFAHITNGRIFPYNPRSPKLERQVTASTTLRIDSTIQNQISSEEIRYIYFASFLRAGIEELSGDRLCRHRTRNIFRREPLVASLWVFGLPKNGFSITPAQARAGSH